MSEPKMPWKQLLKDGEDRHHAEFFEVHPATPQARPKSSEGLRPLRNGGRPTPRP
jgi:hypothetical protein